MSVSVLAGEGSSTTSVSKADRELSELYARHAQSGARLAFLLTGDAHVAEDIVQEAFVRIGSRLTRLHEPDRAVGYLLRTIANLAKDHQRRTKRQDALRKRNDTETVSWIPDVEGRDEVVRALARINPRHRLVLFLRYYMDMAESDAAVALDCSLGAVKSLTHRAGEALRKQLDEERHGPG